MNYYKVIFKIQPDNQENREILMANLAEPGFESFVEEKEHLEGYIPKNLYQAEKIDSFNFKPLFSFTHSSELIPDQNWNEVWEKNYFQPLLIAKRCLIRAPFHTTYPQAEIELIIEPKMAFGTGNHETTEIMTELLLEEDLKNKTVLDMGCGTGILAMVASKTHAKHITAIDIDEWAYQSTLENILLNNCTNITAKQGDASLLGDEKFDLILANIHKNILLEDMQKYSSVLNDGGAIIISGFYEHDLDDLNHRALTLNLEPLKQKTKNKWTAQKYAW